MRRKVRTPEDLTLILPRVIRKLGLERGIKQQKALELWKEVAGKPISDKTTPLEVSDGILKVRVKDSIWRQELYFLKEELKDKLNKSLGEEIIKDIRFYL